MITQEYAKQLFDCLDGHLVWKVSKAKRIKVGSKAGRYEVSFRRNSKSIYCGLFDDLELAELVAIEAVHKVDSLKQQLGK